MSIPEGEQREKTAERLFKEIIQTWERNWIYKPMKLREYLITSMQKDLLQDIILKLSKVNDRILKAAGKKGW